MQHSEQSVKIVIIVRPDHSVQYVRMIVRTILRSGSNPDTVPDDPITLLSSLQTARTGYFPCFW